MLSDYYPTVTNTTCSSGYSCAAGSQCNVSGQCITGNCCAYIMNPDFDPILFNTTTYPGSLKIIGDWKISAKSQAAYNAYLTGAYYTGKYCLPSTNGETNKSYYSDVAGYGTVTTSADTSKFFMYTCSPWIAEWN